MKRSALALALAGACTLGMAAAPTPALALETYFAKMQASERPEFKAMADSLQLSGEGKNVAVSFALPAELLDALEAAANQHRLQR